MISNSTMYLDDLLINPEFMKKLSESENPHGKLDPIGKSYVDGS